MSFFDLSVSIHRQIYDLFWYEMIQNKTHPFNVKRMRFLEIFCCLFYLIRYFSSGS